MRAAEGEWKNLPNRENRLNEWAMKEIIPNKVFRIQFYRRLLRPGLPLTRFLRIIRGPKRRGE
jgi:hypothetical protein